MKLVTVASFSHPSEAELAKSKLESEGIESFVADAHTVQMNWLYSNALGGVKVQVWEADAAKAQEILGTTVPPDEPEDSAVCPNCGATTTQFEKLSRPMVFLSLLLAFPFPIFKRKWRCEKCGHTFK